MATPNTPSLSPDAVNPNDVDFHKLRLYIEDHFRALPGSMRLLTTNLESQSICPFDQRRKICPSLFTNHHCSATYHPEFILRDNRIHWMPRTWICRGFQAQLKTVHTVTRATGLRLSNSRSAHLRYAHNLTTLGYFGTNSPKTHGCRPLYTVSSPSARRVLQAQPFFTEEQWLEKNYKQDIPAPPTYGPDFSEVRIIPKTHSNRRSTTPRRQRSATKPVAWHLGVSIVFRCLKVW